MLEFDIGYGALLLAETDGAVFVPWTPELKGTDVPTIREDSEVGPPVTVWFVNGNGAEVLELVAVPDTPVPGPVEKLVGAVTPPVVGNVWLLELDQGKGAVLVRDEMPVPNPELPVGPAVSEELLTGNGGD
jgi:hypothetical protein